MVACFANAFRTATMFWTTDMQRRRPQHHTEDMEFDCLHFGNSTRTWMFAFDMMTTTVHGRAVYGIKLFRSRLCRSLCQSDFKSYSIFVRSRVAFHPWRGICDSLVHWWRCTDGLLHILLSFWSFCGCCDRPSKSTSHGVGSAAIHS